ncbi:MAG: SH3 domain-containing protein [Bacteriovoracaceae bacterium]
MKLLFLSFVLGVSAQGAIDKFICTEGYTSNLRVEPDLNSSVVVQLSKYTPLILLEENEKWSKVKTKSYEGWIFNNLLSNSFECVLSTKSYKTQQSYSSRAPHKFRQNILTGEGFKILNTEVGMTRVKDKTGNVFWLENHILWPQEKLESLSL